MCGLVKTWKPIGNIVNLKNAQNVNCYVSAVDALPWRMAQMAVSTAQTRNAGRSIEYNESSCLNKTNRKFRNTVIRM